MKFKKTLEKFFSQARVQRQLYSVFIMTLLIPIVGIGFLLLFNSQKTLYDHYQEQAESDSLRVRSIMFDLTTNFYNISENIVNDSTLRELLSNSWDSDFESRAAAESYTELTSTRQQDTSIASAAIYTYNEQLAGHGDFLPINGEVTATPWFRKAASTSAVFWQTLQRDDRYGNTYWELNMFRQIPLPSSRSYAILVLTASDNYLKNRINNSSLDCIITVNQDPVFFSTEKENNGKPIPLEVDYEQYSYMTSGVLSLDGSDTMSAVNTLLPFKSDDKIYIVACGTAYHAGLVGKYAIEKMARIPVEVDIASEFRYRDPLVDEHTLFIAISQSGETLDTLEALREAKSKGARVLSVVNVVGSSVARESDDVFYTWAGPEIAVASTKAYTTQLICMYLIALYFGRLRGTITDEYYSFVLKELEAIPEKIEKVLEKAPEIENLARHLYNRTQVFFIGRGLDSAVSYEGSLKLKEISYINSFAIAAGELKHGTIALMEPETIVIALATQDALFDKMYSNIVEIKARFAHVVAIAKEGNTKIEAESSEVIYIPQCADEVTPLLSVVPLQLFAYYVAREKGEDIDKPRNLAKSVTVE